MKKKILVLCFFGLMYTSAITYAEGFSNFSKLFTLERTLNSNQVVYEADLLNVNYPIHAYWIMRAQDGHTEELTRMERNRGYGTEIVEQSATEIKFVVVSFRSHPLTVRLDPVTQIPYATIVLSSGVKILDNIFLTTSGGIIPKVSKIEISYHEIKDGPILHETIDPNTVF